MNTSIEKVKQIVEPLAPGERQLLKAIIRGGGHGWDIRDFVSGGRTERRRAYIYRDTERMHLIGWEERGRRDGEHLQIAGKLCPNGSAKYIAVSVLPFFQLYVRYELVPAFEKWARTEDRPAEEASCGERKQDEGK